MTKQNRNNLIRMILRILVFFIPFIPALIFGYLEKNSAMITAATIGVFILLFINIDRLESFKGLGVEAKMKELSHLINDGNLILEKLKNLALKLSEPILSDFALKQLPMHKMNSSYIIETYEDIRKLLEELEIKTSDIDKSTELIVKVYKNQFMRLMIFSIRNNSDFYDDLTVEYFKNAQIFDDENAEQRRSELYDKINSIEKLDSETEELFSDYKNFVKTGYIKRKNIFDRK